MHLHFCTCPCAHCAGWTYMATRAAGTRTTPSSQQTQQARQQAATTQAKTRPATAASGQQPSSRAGLEQTGGVGSLEARRAAAALKHLGRQRAKDRSVEEVRVRSGRCAQQTLQLCCSVLVSLLVSTSCS